MITQNVTKVNKNATKRVDNFKGMCYSANATICGVIGIEKGGDNMSVAERLVAARGNIPRTEVIKAVGISLSALTMYEIGQRIPRDEIKVKLAKYYGKTVEELFFAV
jgi:DNA-binding XRE family transcriptional regulator